MFFVSAFLFGQANESKIRTIILEKNIVGKEFTFGKWNEEGGTETNLTYLGRVKTKNGKIYKIMNYTWIWGLSARATNRILIFNEKNQYLGNYYLTTINDLPTELKSSYLIFKNTDEDCDKNIVTKINFNNGIPKSFFRKCNKEYGDIFSFES